jgi:hypothetical protein
MARWSHPRLATTRTGCAGKRSTWRPTRAKKPAFGLWTAPPAGGAMSARTTLFSRMSRKRMGPRRSWDGRAGRSRGQGGGRRRAGTAVRARRAAAIGKTDRPLRAGVAFSQHAGAAGRGERSAAIHDAIRGCRRRCARCRRPFQDPARRHDGLGGDVERLDAAAWLLDRAILTTNTLQTTNCHVLDDGRFWAWEGIGCCPGTCAHVWHYAQGVARLFPDRSATCARSRTSASP